MEWLSAHFDVDALRATFAITNFIELYHAHYALVASVGLASVLAGVVGCLVLFSKHSRFAVATPLATAIKYVKNVGRNSRISNFIRAKFGNKKMRKEREAAHEEELRDTLIDKIEAMVDEGRMTRKEADDRYAGYCRQHPRFLYALSRYRESSVKERIQEEQANRERNEDGTVVPLPIPTAKEVVALKAQRRRQNIR